MDGHSLSDRNLDARLTVAFRKPVPPDLVMRTDRRIAQAIGAHDASRRADGHVHLVRALIAAIALLVGVVGVAGAQRALDGTEANANEGVTNVGQPLEGLAISEMQPSEIQAVAAERGYQLRWQIEARNATDTDADDLVRFEVAAPACGRVVGGAAVGEQLIQIVVVQDDPEDPGSTC